MDFRGGTARYGLSRLSVNPWLGCTKVNPGCDLCYAESWAKRMGSPERWNGKRRCTTPDNRKQLRKRDSQAAAAGGRKRVFCASLADSDNEVPPDVPPIHPI